MASLSRRIRRNMARPIMQQRRRNQRALARVAQPLAQGMAQIGRDAKIVEK